MSLKKKISFLIQYWLNLTYFVFSRDPYIFENRSWKVVIVYFYFFNRSIHNNETISVYKLSENLNIHERRYIFQFRFFQCNTPRFLENSSETNWIVLWVRKLGVFFVSIVPMFLIRQFGHSPCIFYPTAKNVSTQHGNRKFLSCLEIRTWYL